MKHVHYHIRRPPMGPEVDYLFVIQYHYDGEVIVVSNVGIHPIDEQGVIRNNICSPEQVVNDDVYHDAIEMLRKDGLVA